jgi:ABC-type sugar transport system, permease component
MNKRHITFKTLIIASAVILTVVLLFPYVVMVVTALKDKPEVYAIPPSFLPKHWRFSNFIDIWSKVHLLRFITNTVFVALTDTLITLVCAVPAAYALARMKFKGSRAYLYMIIVTQMFSPIVLLVGLYRIIGMLGLIDSLWGLIIVDAAFNQAFAVWILRGTFATIPVELEQAAWIDGCSKWQALKSIMLPLAAPGIITALIFVFIAAWNEFTVALTVISSEDLKPLTVGIYAFFGRYDIQWQYLFATSIIATIPVIVLFLSIEKHLISGLTAGGVKE